MNTTENQNIEKLKTELKAKTEEAAKTEKAAKDKADKIAKLAKLQEHVESINKKIDSLITAKHEAQAKAKSLHKEMFGNGGGRGRGSKNFGKIKPAVLNALTNAESAMTVNQIADKLSLTYASVYQTLKNAPENFKRVNKHWMAVKPENKTEKAEAKEETAVAA